jgi:hypothetical protein
MEKRVCVILLALLFIVGINGCGDKVDQAELDNANTLSDGIMAMMTNVDAYSGFNGSAPKPELAGPPWPWEGPDTFPDIPEGTQTLYYYQKIQANWEETVDTLLKLIMLTPDVWNDTIPDTSFVTALDIWHWFVVNNDVWWHFTLEMEESDTAHLSGTMKWNYQDTWLNYVFTDMGVIPTDESGVIDVTTSDNIKLSAHFEFIEDGSGTGWGKFQNYEFVRFTFYPDPTPEGYIGHYTLASEGWKKEHPFPEQ